MQEQEKPWTDELKWGIACAQVLCLFRLCEDEAYALVKNYPGFYVVTWKYNLKGRPVIASIRKRRRKNEQEEKETRVSSTDDRSEFGEGG